MNAGLAVALQCKARGWNDLAQELWTASLRQDTGHPFGAFYQPPNLPNRTAVAYLAWAHSGNELVKPDTDRAKTARRMKTLLATEPRLNTEGQPGTPQVAGGGPRSRARPSPAASNG